MPEYHPDRDALESFARGESSGRGEDRIESHLRTGCAVCQVTVDSLLPGLEEGDAVAAVEPAAPRPSTEAPDRSLASQAPEAGVSWDRFFTRLEQHLALITFEKDAAPRLLRELVRYPPAERRRAVRARPRFQTLALCDLLLERSGEESFRDPAAATELAELAVAVAVALDARYYGAVAQDLKARAWAFLGDARRANSDLAGAEQALALAETLAEEGSADPLEEAKLLDLKASLLGDQGRLEEAAEVLELVTDIYDEVRDLHRKGCTLIRQGLFLGYAGRSGQAVELIPEGLTLVDWNQEPQLVLTARHQLAWFWNDCGQYEKALGQVERLRCDPRELPASEAEPPLEWLEARIAIGLGHHAEAEARLTELMRRFAEQGLGYNASLVTLDLAILYLSQGRGGEVRALACELLPILLSQDAHRQVIVALVVFQQAVENGCATPLLVRKISSYLLRARRNPELVLELAA
ncbi:MAG: hypothetical protein M3O15_09810 [Acidobacteriota bacterium]|nr:hypothetical protein [Acidobacteriota bacterium]